MSVAFLYPGQGAQFAGMLHQLPDLSKVNETLREASEVLGHVETLDRDAGLSVGAFAAAVALGRLPSKMV